MTEKEYKEAQNELIKIKKDMSENVKNLTSALKKMGFGSTLNEALPAFKLALHADPMPLIESIDDWSFTKDEKSVVGLIYHEHLENLQAKNEG